MAVMLFHQTIRALHIILHTENCRHQQELATHLEDGTLRLLVVMPYQARPSWELLTLPYMHIGRQTHIPLHLTSKTVLVVMILLPPLTIVLCLQQKHQQEQVIPLEDITQKRAEVVRNTMMPI